MEKINSLNSLTSFFFQLHNGTCSFLYYCFIVVVNVVSFTLCVVGPILSICPLVFVTRLPFSSYFLTTSLDNSLFSFVDVFGNTTQWEKRINSKSLLKNKRMVLEFQFWTSGVGLQTHIIAEYLKTRFIKIREEMAFKIHFTVF